LIRSLRSYPPPDSFLPIRLFWLRPLAKPHATLKGMFDWRTEQLIQRDGQIA
jgi:hypothetical protein